MLRNKILGQDQFSQNFSLNQKSINTDLGDFMIGNPDLEITDFVPIPMPPKYLWIRAKIVLTPCPEILVSKLASEFIWSATSCYQSVRLEPLEILYAQKDYWVDACWTLSPDNPHYLHEFAVAKTMHERASGMHLWACGGVAINGEFEQAFGQIAGKGQTVYVNGLKTWREYLLDADDKNVVFEPPPGDFLSLKDAIKLGKFCVNILQAGLSYNFSSCMIDPDFAPPVRTEQSTPDDHINILCQWRDQ